MPAGALKGDKKTYNMDPANGDEAVREVAADLRRGRGYGDGQPGLPYLDNCARLKAEFRVPTVAYQVSEEYAMIVAAEERGWIDGFRAVLETLLAFRRAGCDGVPTNFAPRAARLLRGRSRAGFGVAPIAGTPNVSPAKPFSGRIASSSYV